jgi:hypothetical protein
MLTLGSRSRPDFKIALLTGKHLSFRQLPITLTTKYHVTLEHPSRSASLNYKNIVREEHDS